jgi:dihydrofolate reductase
MNAIVCVNNTNGIGIDGDLLYKIPGDIRYFKRKTTGGDANVVIMGRKTFESIGKALPGRINIVMSRREYSAPGVIVVHNVPHVIDIIKGLVKSSINYNITVIGGAGIYKAFEKHIKIMYVTRVFDNKHSDTIMDTCDCFIKATCSSICKHGNLTYRYEKYINNNFISLYYK